MPLVGLPKRTISSVKSWRIATATPRWKPPSTEMSAVMLVVGTSSMFASTGGLPSQPPAVDSRIECRATKFALFTIAAEDVLRASEQRSAAALDNGEWDVWPPLWQTVEAEPVITDVARAL
jgi:hypothetical protein